MHELQVSALRPKTQTVSVYTRHSAKCGKKNAHRWKRCKCIKCIYLLRDGKNQTISAKTRSWEKAESRAQEILDSWDPVKFYRLHPSGIPQKTRFLRAPKSLWNPEDYLLVRESAAWRGGLFCSGVETRSEGNIPLPVPSPQTICYGSQLTRLPGLVRVEL